MPIGGQHIGSERRPSVSGGFPAGAQAVLSVETIELVLADGVAGVVQPLVTPVNPANTIINMSYEHEPVDPDPLVNQIQSAGQLDAAVPPAFIELTTNWI